jgi:hypothetical protein
MVQVDLITRIIAHSGAIKYPPLSEKAVADAERELGFALPPFLRELYLRIGNGGFGPRGGIEGLNSEGLCDLGGYNVVSGYQTMQDRNAPNPTPFPWPERILLLTNVDNYRYWTALDCTRRPTPVLSLDMTWKAGLKPGSMARSTKNVDGVDFPARNRRGCLHLIRDWAVIIRLFWIKEETVAKSQVAFGSVLTSIIVNYRVWGRDSGNTHADYPSQPGDYPELCGGGDQEFHIFQDEVTGHGRTNLC